MPPRPSRARTSRSSRDEVSLREFLLETRSDTPAMSIGRIVHVARLFLGLETVVVVESVINLTGDDEWVVRHEDSAHGVTPAQVASLSRLVLGGRLPEFVPDLREVGSDVIELDLTQPGSVRTMLCVPVRLAGGRRYGAFLCLSSRVETHINERDHAVIQLLADLIGDLVQRGEHETQLDSADAERLAKVIDRSELRMAFQPIVRLSDRQAVGYEALARFPASMRGSPDHWFARAWDVGLGLELELHALRAATADFGRLGDGYVSVNASAITVMAPEFAVIVERLPAARLVVEVTEHAAAENIESLAQAIDDFSDLGVRLAIDDLGTGFAGLSEMLTLAPDIIKLDRRLTSNIDVNTAQQALVAALSTFALRVGAELVGEGIESEAQLVALRVLGVACGQGYLLGRPVLGRGH